MHNSNWSSTAELYHRIGLQKGPSWGRAFYDFVGSLKKSPTLADFNSYLSQFGWSTARIDGFITPKQYYTFLNKQILPVNLAIRSSEEILHSREPDLIHEVFGHMMQLQSSDFRLLMKKFGKVGSNLEDTTKIDRLAWWFFESALFDDGRRLIPTGAVILSSETEISRIIKTGIVRPLDESALLKDFDPAQLQPEFYSYSSYETIWNLLNRVGL
jgi:phenylalanine-4-hydroxylase